MSTLHFAVSVLAITQFTLEATEYVVARALAYAVWRSLSPEERASATAGPLRLMYVMHQTRLGRTAFRLYVLVRWWQFPLYVALAVMKRRKAVRS